MLESIILGIIQGVAEWLPVSSEGMIFLAKTNFFNSGEGIKEIASLALFLHFGTFLAALVYFRKDVSKLIKTLFSYKEAKKEDKKIFWFLVVTTLLSGSLGYALLSLADKMTSDNLESITQIVTIGVGVLLLFTAWLQIRAKRGGDRKEENLNSGDSVSLGLIQALAALPGLSRSGLTVSALLLKKFNEESALKLSFLMSLPIVLAGNIILNLNEFALTAESLLGLLFSFGFGLLTINLLLRMAKKINFGYFVLAFGILMILAGLF